MVYMRFCCIIGTSALHLIVNCCNTFLCRHDLWILKV